MMPLVLLATAAAGASTPAATRPPSPGWEVSCTSGTDEFASNCLARRRDGPYRLRLSTADSQLYLIVEIEGCASRSENFWRDAVIGMPASERQHLMKTLLRRLAAELARDCGVRRRQPIDLKEPPDIAVWP